MYQRIICEKGKIYLCTDLGKKLEAVNNLNLVEIASFDNDLEMLSDERENLKLEIKEWNRNEIKLIIESIIIAFGVIFLSILIQILELMTGTLPIFYFFKFITYIGLPITFLQLVFLQIPVTKRRAYGCAKTIEYISKKEKQILRERDKVVRQPGYALIREGQEFDIKIDKDLPIVLDMINGYYSNRDRIEKDFLLFHKLGLKKKDIHELFRAINQSSGFNVSDSSLNELVEEIYNNMSEREKDIKIKKKVK